MSVNYSEHDLGGHTHTDDRGYLHRCYHTSQAIYRRYTFWIGLTIGFPIEHFLWEKVPVFSNITGWLGL